MSICQFMLICSTILIVIIKQNIHSVRPDGEYYILPVDEAGGELVSTYLPSVYGLKLSYRCCRLPGAF